MVTIFFFGVDLKFSELKAISAFKNAEILSEKGREAKIGFKKGTKADFSMAMVTVENDYDDNVDTMLFETMELLRNNKSKIYNGKVESISIQFHLKTAKDICFSMDSESIHFSKNIPVDIEFEIEQDQRQLIEAVITDLTRKYRLHPSAKPLRLPGNY